LSTPPGSLHEIVLATCGPGWRHSPLPTVVPTDAPPIGLTGSTLD
jgi:hypothetical protein